MPVLHSTATSYSKDRSMSVMSMRKRGARVVNHTNPTRRDYERNAAAKVLRFGRLLMVSVVLGLAGLAAVMTTASPAYANSTPSISAYGGPGEIWVTGSGFTPSATVRLVALSNPGLKSVGYAQYTAADGSGNITAGFSTTSGTLLRTYTGPVYVLADQAGLPTAGATTVVNAPPQFLINGTGQTSCGSVNAEITGFEHFYNVRVELLSQDLTKLLDIKYVSSDRVGDVSLSPSPAASGPALSTSGYTGGAWIIADEYGGWPPAPAEAGYHLNV